MKLFSIQQHAYGSPTMVVANTIQEALDKLNLDIGKVYSIVAQGDVVL